MTWNLNVLGLREGPLAFKGFYQRFWQMAAITRVGLAKTPQHGDCLHHVSCYYKKTVLVSHTGVIKVFIAYRHFDLIGEEMRHCSVSCGTSRLCPLCEVATQHMRGNTKSYWLKMGLHYSCALSMFALRFAVMTCFSRTRTLCEGKAVISPDH